MNPLADLGLHSLVDAQRAFPRQTWALALHRTTMKQALAPISRERSHYVRPIRDCARAPDGPLKEACRAVLRAFVECEGEVS